MSIWELRQAIEEWLPAWTLLIPIAVVLIALLVLRFKR